jgi:DNA-cytosine methyltransferase
MNKLKLLDLFSGIGGFSLGLESTGYFQTIAFVEKDKFCRQVLQKNFNNIPIEEDIRNVRGSNYAADVITGGFPCQPFSVAGKRKGTADDRYLWDETIRVVAECKPRWFIGENVEGLININNGMVLRQVQTDLEEQGFQVQCIVIPASGIGAWHQRKRIWIVACNLSYSYNNGSYRSQRNETEQSCNEQKNRLSFRNDKDVPNSSSKRSSSQSIGVNRELAEKSKGKKETRDQSTLRTSSSCSDVPNSNTSLRGGRGAEFQSRDDGQWGFYSEKEKQTRDDIRSKVIGCNDILREETTNKTWWQTQSEFCGVPNGISYELDKDRSSRIKALGNSIVPQIARQIGLSIMKAELN